MSQGQAAPASGCLWAEPPRGPGFTNLISSAPAPESSHDQQARVCQGADPLGPWGLHDTLCYLTSSPLHHRGAVRGFLFTHNTAKCPTRTVTADPCCLWIPCLRTGPPTRVLSNPQVNAAASSRSLPAMSGEQKTSSGHKQTSPVWVRPGHTAVPSCFSSQCQCVLSVVYLVSHFSLFCVFSWWFHCSKWPLGILSKSCPVSLSARRL